MFSLKNLMFETPLCKDKQRYCPTLFSSIKLPHRLHWIKTLNDMLSPFQGSQKGRSTWKRQFISLCRMTNAFSEHQSHLSLFNSESDLVGLKLREILPSLIPHVRSFASSNIPDLWFFFGVSQKATSSPCHETASLSCCSCIVYRFRVFKFSGTRTCPEGWQSSKEYGSSLQPNFPTSSRVYREDTASIRIPRLILC